MALTTADQNKVVQLLGYGGKILQPGSVIYNKILNDRLVTLPPDTETLIQNYLCQVRKIESQMNAAPSRLMATAVADIKVNNEELAMLRKERRKIAKEIASHLDIPYIGANSMNVAVCS